MSTALAPTAPRPAGAMVDIASSRQAQEVQAAMAIAKTFPRDETAAIERVRQACQRLALAEQSTYSYPKGGKKITGPSIRLAETLARCWGNLDFGLIELDQRDGESDLMAYCWDLETNTRNTKIFTVRHERHSEDGGVTLLTDPRDIYEVGANYGARRLRACVLAVVPGDVQDLAVAECQKTLAGVNSEPLIDRVRAMVHAFAAEGVSLEAIEGRLGHRVEACNEQDIVTLREIYKSLKDGMSNREDWFSLAPASGLDEPADNLQAQGAAESPAPDEPPEAPPTEEAATATEAPAAGGNGDKAKPSRKTSKASRIGELVERIDLSTSADEVDTYLSRAKTDYSLTDADLKRIMARGQKRRAQLDEAATT